jgi:hypothetical protein
MDEIFNNNADEVVSVDFEAHNDVDYGYEEYLQEMHQNKFLDEEEIDLIELEKRAEMETFMRIGYLTGKFPM